MAAEQEDASEKESIERRSPSGKTVYHAILGEGEEELARPSSALFWSGLAGGLAMGFSLITEGLLTAHLPHENWTPLITKLGYSIGFLIVILGRQQLFTENTLTPILPLLKHKRAKILLDVLRLWSIVLIANLLGALVVAWTIVSTSVLSPETHDAVLAISQQSIGHPFVTVFMRAIFAGWLIAMIVWLLPYAESAHVWVIVILTWLIGIAHFSHIVAGAVNVFALAISHRAGWGEIISSFLIPTFLGNTIGGVLLVACLNHAQIVSGDE